MYPNIPPKIENRVQFIIDLKNLFLLKCMMGIRTTSGGMGKKILSMNAIRDKKNWA
jgi:hypothetical protein